MTDLKKANEFIKEISNSSKEVLLEEAISREEKIRRLDFLIKYLKTEYDKLIAEYEYIAQLLNVKEEETDKTEIDEISTEVDGTKE